MDIIPQLLASDGAMTWGRFGALLLAIWGGFYHVLPAILETFERKQSGIEIRTNELLDAQAKRFQEQLESADNRHDECMEGQKLLRQEIDHLWGIINAMRQGALSVENMVAKTVRDAREGGTA